MPIPKHLTGGHWYCAKTGEPRHFIEKKDGSGPRKTTLADAKKNGWLPSPTSILRVLDKPALNEWRVRNAIEATLTTPHIVGESVDDFAARVMSVDAESIGDAAKQMGTDIHDVIEANLVGNIWNTKLFLYVKPVADKVLEMGRVVATEKVLVGDGYAGRTDCIVENDEFVTVIDFKTTGSEKLAVKSYPEWRYQLAAYGKALGNTGNKRIRTCNIPISTRRPGELSVLINDDWEEDYATFDLIKQLWCRINNYHP